MRISSCWQDYRILDTSGGEKLEKWGEYLLIRPDPQIIWNTERRTLAWEKADARYIRSSSGGGRWDNRTLPDIWQIHYRDLCFALKPMGFKHTGLFPEQAVNWDWMSKKIKSCAGPVKVLNLFAYTGAATLACAGAGAQVVHVDASKGMVAWAKENAGLSGLRDRPIRYLVDDCIKFAHREIRRGNRYDAIILDPPSYGRGPGGEIWKIEEQIYELLLLCTALLTDKPLFLMLNSYTTGLSPSVMSYLLGVTAAAKFGGSAHADEIGLPVASTGLVLPCGSTAIWELENTF